jgi:hypothetical protein
VVKAPLDGQLQAPVRAPTPLPGDAEGRYGRLARARARRVRMHRGLAAGLSHQGDARLGQAIRSGRHASRALTAVALGAHPRPHRRRQGTPGRQAVPELGEVICEIGLDGGKRCLLTTRRTRVRLHPFRGLPHPPLGHTDRRCCGHGCLPSVVDPHAKLHAPPPSLPPPSRGCDPTTGCAAPGPRLGTLPRVGPPLAGRPWPRGARGPRATPKPGSRSRPLDAGRRSGSQPGTPALLLASRRAPVVTSSLRLRPLVHGSLALGFVLRT